MFFGIRIFTATLGGKNFLTKRQVFSNIAEKGKQNSFLENYLHFWKWQKCSQKRVLIKTITTTKENFCAP